MIGTDVKLLFLNDFYEQIVNRAKCNLGHPYLILKQVSDKNPGNARGKTPLHYAARNGHFETCQLITKSVKDIHPRDSDGNTPLLLAVDRNHLDIVKLFLDNPDKDPLIEDEIREALRFLCGKKANHETEEP